MDALPPHIEIVVSQARDLYVSLFLETLAVFSGKKIITEAVYLNKDGKPIGDGPLNLPMRIDVFEVGAGATMIASSRQLGFEPMSFKIGSASVRLEPFTWDYVSVTANIVPGKPAIEPLLKWFGREFNVDEVSGDGGEIKVIHFMSDPKPVPAGMTFELDLGTAEISAFTRMLTALIEAGSTEIVVSTGESGQ
jgi:hypothetical protein